MVSYLDTGLIHFNLLEVRVTTSVKLKINKLESWVERVINARFCLEI